MFYICYRYFCGFVCMYWSSQGYFTMCELNVLKSFKMLCALCIQDALYLFKTVCLMCTKCDVPVEHICLCLLDVLDLLRSFTFCRQAVLNVYSCWNFKVFVWNILIPSCKLCYVCFGIFNFIFLSYISCVAGEVRIYTKCCVCCGCFKKKDSRNCDLLY